METGNLYVIIAAALLLNFIMIYLIVRYSVKAATQPLKRSINFLLHFKFEEMKENGKSDQFINKAIRKMKDYKNWEVVNIEEQGTPEEGTKEKKALFVH